MNDGRSIGAFCAVGMVLAASGMAIPVRPVAGTASIDVSREVFVMGTRATLVTYARDRVVGLARLDGFLRIIEETERELSTWRPDSQLSRLNRHPVGAPFALDDRLCELFRTVRYWQHESLGAFDPAVGALIDVWGVRTGGAIPSADDQSRARAVSGFQHLAFDPRGCTIARTVDVTMDAGAFGKGEALDRVRTSRLTEDPWLIDFGGQVAAHGRPPGRAGWPVGLAHPNDRMAHVLELLVSGGSLAVSGGSERDLDVRGTRVGHILDRRTGAPVVGGGAVAVWDDRALVADILSTALYVMGPADGIPWANARGLAACYLSASDADSLGPTTGVASRAFSGRFGPVCGSRMSVSGR